MRPTRLKGDILLLEGTRNMAVARSFKTNGETHKPKLLYRNDWAPAVIAGGRQ